MANNALTKHSTLSPGSFDDFFRPWSALFNGIDRDLSWPSPNLPAVNVTEDKDDYKMSMAIPGLKKDDFKITIDGGILTVSAEKEDSHTEKEKQYTRQEFNYSGFTRSFTLPAGVNKDHLDAKYEDGILHLTLPKKEEAKRSSDSIHVPVK